MEISKFKKTVLVSLRVGMKENKMGTDSKRGFKDINFREVKVAPRGYRIRRLMEPLAFILRA